MKKFLLSVALCVCGVFTINAQQDLKKSVCVVKQNHTDAETETYEKNSKIVVSKMNRFHVRLNRHSLSILISYILIAIMGLVMYLKVFKGI